MSESRPIHPDFQHFLELKSQEMIDLFHTLRKFILEVNPDCNELFYHTHALVDTFTLSEKLGDAYCSIVIYSQHMSISFNQGAHLPDPEGLLQGTGRSIRHVRIDQIADLQQIAVKHLVEDAIKLARKELSKPPRKTKQLISKIKR